MRLVGFTYSHGNPGEGGYYKNAKFYYTRNTYKIRFINNGKEDKSVEKKYEQSISSENYTPARPSSLPEYYVFDGWYENELCEGEAFNFTGQKMPAQNVTLYAKWSAEQISLTYNLNNPEGTVAKDTKKVEAGTVASTALPNIPTINEYSFAGWYYADGNGNITSEVFNTNNTITRDTSIVGKWLYKGELRVVYNPGTEKDATVPTDDKVYAGGARVTVAGNATTTSGKKFLGWELNGNVYKPGQSFEVNKGIANKDNQIILTATWGNAETSTTLTYDPGNGIGTVTTRVEVMNNVAVEIEAHNSLGFTAPVAEGKEYYFAGWADSKTGNATYADGQTINIDANGENVLYAVWVEKAEITLVAKSGTRTYNGAEQSIEGFEPTTMNGYTVSGLTAVTKGTDVGEYTNTVFDGTATVEKDGVDVTDKVAVKTRAGKLVITPKSIKTQEITVTKPADSQYDGKEHKWSPTVTDKADKKLEAVTDYTVEYSTSDFTNVTGTITVTITGIGNYTGTVVRTYAITPAEVTVTANNANKVYGENDPELKATVTGTLNNDTVDYTVTRDPGEDVDKYAIHVTGDEDQGNYHVTYTAGEFEITKSGELILTAELTGESATKVYDGNPLAGGATSNVKEGTTITYSTDGGATWTTEVPSITNVGTLNITARAENPNYEPAETTYSLTVTHATAIVTAENKTKVYGTADPELTATVSGTLGNDTVAYTLARKAGENAGKYKITVTGEENQGNYKVTYTPGTFEITPKSIIPDGPKTPEEKKTGITVTAPEGSKYDGEEHKNKPTVTDTKTGKTLTEETDYTLTYSEDVTNAGKVTVTVTGIGNYTGEFDVTYEITKRDVVLTSATDSKPYDGTALRNENVEVTGDGFAAGEGATFAVTGTITNVGTKANTFGYALNKNTLASNYNISTELGTLTITPKSIIPDGPKTPEDKKTGITVENPGDVKYDGKDHAEKPVIKDEKTGVTLEEGKDYEIVYPEDIKNAGEITATVVGKGDYEGSFEIKYNITKRDVTFTSATDSKQYDGNTLTNGNVEITGDGFIEGEGAEYKVIGTQTQVGNSANEFEYTLNENTLASNYDITKVVGTLTVTAAPAPETPEKPKPEVKKSVDTSDDNNIVFYGNAFFMAMITLAGIIVLRKKSS